MTTEAGRGAIDSANGRSIIRATGGMVMKKVLAGILILGLALVFIVAAGPKSYQVTGTVKALTDTTISVEKSNGEVWEVGRDASLKVTGGQLAVGAKVTVFYKMVAVSAEVKAK
jgi:hypothetical protein